MKAYSSYRRVLCSSFGPTNTDLGKSTLYLANRIAKPLGDADTGV